MKLVSPDCRVRVFAALDDESGTLSLKVVGHAEYATGRTTSADVTQFPPEVEDSVRQALTQALTCAKAPLGARVMKAIAKSTEVSATFGEI